MIAVVRSRTLHDLRADVVEAEAAAAAARAEAEQRRQEGERATDSAIRAESAVEELQTALARTTADAARLEGELETLRAQSLLDTEDRQALRTLLRITRKQSGLADRVYVLFHHGQLHSVHATMDAAESAAEAEGAPREGWTAHTPGAALPPASEVLWRVQPLPLGGATP
jgi:chromosome segregation ATPase